MMQMDKPNSEQSLSRPVTTPIPTVGFWHRWRASIADSAILGTVDEAISKFLGSWATSGGWEVALDIIRAAIPVIYFIWAYSSSGQTPGKRLLKIRVVSVDGSPLNWRKGVLRTIGYAISTIPFYLGYLWSIWDKDKQTWHDKISGTRVVPDSVTNEQLQGTVDPLETRRSQRRWQLATGISTLLTLIVYSVLAISLLTALQKLEEPPYGDKWARLHDEEYTKLGDALAKRWGPDDSIPAASYGFDVYGSGGDTQTQYWFVIEISYTGTCNGTSNNSCETLVNELARLVFDHYGHIDEITGIEVMITNYSTIGPVDYSITPVDKALTIAEWRKELSLEK